LRALLGLHDEHIARQMIDPIHHRGESDKSRLPTGLSDKSIAADYLISVVEDASNIDHSSAIGRSIDTIGFVRHAQ
jgi:hypothetical protein